MTIFETKTAIRSAYSGASAKQGRRTQVCVKGVQLFRSRARIFEGSRPKVYVLESSSSKFKRRCSMQFLPFLMNRTDEWLESTRERVTGDFGVAQMSMVLKPFTYIHASGTW